MQRCNWSATQLVLSYRCKCYFGGTLPRVVTDPHQRGSHLSVATSTLLPQLERASKSTLSQNVRLERALVAQRTNYILILSPPLNQNEYNPF